MIITNLMIENLGLFRGQHEFNLSPKSSNGEKRSIILIGGKNGSGKTTLFEAVRLCLYGPNLQKKRFSKKDYEKYISGIIHHTSGSKVQPSEARVEVGFEYSHLGNVDKYIVQRLWRADKEKYIEKLLIEKNGDILTDFDIDQWQDFLNDLIPPGVSKLFFFDGEKIQHLAEEHEEGIHLRESFKSLLGLDVVARLQSDLGIYSARHLKKIGIVEIEKEILKLEEEEKRHMELLDNAFQDRAQLQSSHDQILGEIERQELKISNIGGSFASKRDKLKNDKNKLDTEIEMVENQIRKLAHNLLPFAITPKYCQILKEHLIEEDKYQKWKSTQLTLDSKRREFGEIIQSSLLWDNLEVSTSTRQSVIKRLIQVVNDVLKSSDKFEKCAPIHQLSQLEAQKMINWINLSFNDVPDQLINSTKKLEKLTRKLQSVELNLTRAPKDDVLHPLIQKLNESNKEMGQIQEQIKVKDDNIRQIEFKLTDCRRRLRTQLDKVHDHSELSTRLVLCNKVQAVMKEYTSQLHKEKIKEFNEMFITYFNSLSHKDNLIHTVKISEKDFSVTLYDCGEKEIQKEQLSAGEKEIYAIAMIWTLTKISGRPLPFIIDTPLGRLDSDHREAIVMDFFPNASHQIIIFSTDTEVDKEYFEILKPYIARNYHLQYSKKQRMTTTTLGYFWDDKEGIN